MVARSGSLFFKGLHTMKNDSRGFYVMTFGGGRYTSIAWYPNRAEAEAEAARRRHSGLWSGKPPIVEPV